MVFLNTDTEIPAASLRHCDFETDWLMNSDQEHEFQLNCVIIRRDTKDKQSNSDKIWRYSSISSHLHSSPAAGADTDFKMRVPLWSIRVVINQLPC